MDYQTLFDTYKESSIQGRYICLKHIEPYLLQLKTQGKVFELSYPGYAEGSVLQQPIYAYKNGKGNQKVMMWSQMHGNESTTTKALLDFFNYLDSEEGKSLTEKFTFLIIPMLNPDGAEAWTRVNANGVDLNRDSQNLTQPESRILRKCIEEFRPDFCFNLHDQRTIFGVEGTRNPATISFLAPSYDVDKNTNEPRKRAMEVIVYMNQELQKHIPNQVGRFDDSFNINCIGDTVMNMGIPVVLIEAGHYPGDYQREITRKYVFISLISGLKMLNLAENLTDKHLEYFNISHNKVFFFDFIYKNIKLNYENKQIITNFAVQLSESIENQKLIFEGYIREIGELEGFYGHLEFDGQSDEFKDLSGRKYPILNQIANFYIGDTLFKNTFPDN